MTRPCAVALHGLCILAAAILVSAGAGGQPDEVPAMQNEHYISNRAPLEPSRLIKLPIGAIEPRGWLRHQLQIQADGFHGHLREISPWLATEGNAWLDARGVGERGWEEVPYWLKGYLNCALVLRDEAMLAEAMVWIEGALNSQQEDGWFGPDKGRTGLATDLQGREDLWPNMIMLFCLMDYYDVSADERVLTLMSRYFRYLAALPEEEFLVGYWPKLRAGDQLHAIHWLYNRTGERWLLGLAEKTHEHTGRWDEGVIDWHNVNIAQAFREPTQWWVQSHDEGDFAGAERNWREVRERYGQAPGGMFGADENARPGFDDPRQAIETCGLVEEMLSDEILLAITGDMAWADRCEDVAFNMLPAAFTADMRALRYLSAPNQPVSDAANHSPGIQNGGPMFLMSPHRHRCCQHNAGHGWPYYAQHLWYATPDNGLAAVLYSECEVTARVGDGREVRIAQHTDYPFGESVRLVMSLDEDAEFPLHLRIPGWCEGARITVNGAPAGAEAAPGTLVEIMRRWSDGDTVDLRLPMRTRARVWEASHDAVSIHRGPLAFSLDIGEEHRPYEDAGAQNKQLTDAEVAALNERWPAWEIVPTGEWNLGLTPEAVADPASSIGVSVLGPVRDGVSPWTPATAPMALTAPARRVAEWQLDAHGLAAPLQDSPARTDEPIRSVRLIPMGAARIRISALPVASDSAEANAWSPPQRARRLFDAAASHTNETDSVAAVADGLAPSGSDDQAVARHTFWPNLGTLEWLQAGFGGARRVASVSVYWYDDTGQGRCRVPASWRALYRAGDAWRPVATSDEYGVARDQFNTVTFEPVTTDALRLEVQLREGYSGGVLEWSVE
ncbi:MAG TPA: beta-L-arabinofuranosidase domain-containing protein [Phycisphaerales bacterium]|nr:beta-L-arabinofuranosidase domain-containing protein [Phycisphaerales bacterium]